MVEVVVPVTRLRSAASVEGCWMETTPPCPIEKLCQFTMAVGEVCTTERVPGPPGPTVTAPYATLGAEGSSAARATVDPARTLPARTLPASAVLARRAAIKRARFDMSEAPVPEGPVQKRTAPTTVNRFESGPPSSR